jgi:hypothetical protein
MFGFLRLLSLLVLATATAEAQGSLSDLFSILRAEGPRLSESARIRTFQILEPYSTGKKSLDGEWAAINDALNDPSPFVRDQACAALAAILYVSSTGFYGTPVRPTRLPDPTRELVIQRLSESQSNLRENAVRTCFDGGRGASDSCPPVTPNGEDRFWGQRTTRGHYSVSIHPNACSRNHRVLDTESA